MPNGRVRRQQFVSGSAASSSGSTASTTGATAPARATARRRVRTPSVAAAFSAAFACAQHGADDREPLAHHREDRERRRRARQRADEHDPALQCRRRDVGLDVRTADEIEHDVGAAVSVASMIAARERVGVERAVGVRGRDDARGRARARRTARASSAVRAVPTTRAPSALRELQPGGADPAPDRVHERPIRRAAACARVTSASWAVTNASGTPPIVTRSRPSGIGAQCAAGTRTYSAWRAAARDAEHRGRRRRRRRAGPAAATTPANSRPGMSGGEPGGAG